MHTISATPAGEQDILMMRRALQLAALGRGFASPNPMVGAVITDGAGLIVGQGWHRKWGEAHAEVNAVAAARARGADLRTCTIYVTLEPCAHYGKTPPCAQLLAECGFRRAVIGTPDPFPKVAGRGLEILREAGIELTVGVLEQECRELNRNFLYAHTHSRPRVLLKWAQSTDGFIAASGGCPVRLSSPLTEVLMHRRRADVDAILAGTDTLINDDPSLTLRLWPGSSPRPVVIDSPRLPSTLRLLANPATIRLPHSTPLPELLSRLYSEHGITSLLVEGGATLLQSFIEADLWQEMRIEVAPLRLGDGVPAPRIELAGLSPHKCGDSIIYTSLNE